MDRIHITWKLFLCMCCIYASSELSFAQNEIMSLDSARAISLQNNNAIKAAGYNVNVATSNLQEAKGGHLPSIDLSATYIYLADPVSFSGNEVAGLLNNIYQGGVSVQQNIFSGNRVKNNVLLKEEMERMAAAQQTLTISEILYRTDLYYWQTVAMFEMLHVSYQFDSVVNRLHQDVEDRVSDGLSPSNDMLQSKVRVNESALYVMQTDNAFSISKMELNNALGRDPNVDYNVPDSILFYSFNSMNFNDTLSIDSVALNNRPEIDISESSFYSSLINEKLVKADYYPSIGLSLSGRYGVPGVLPDYEIPNLNFMGYVYLKYPIFQGNMRRNRVDASQFNTLISGEQLEQQKKDILLEVNKSAYSFQESISKVKLTQNSLSQAKLNLDAVNTKYTEGLAPLAEVLDAQMYWLNASRSYIQAKLENKVSLSLYEKALGLY